MYRECTVNLTCMYEIVYKHKTTDSDSVRVMPFKHVRLFASSTSTWSWRDIGRVESVNTSTASTVTVLLPKVLIISTGANFTTSRRMFGGRIMNVPARVRTQIGCIIMTVMQKTTRILILTVASN